jgi:predicted HD phosphohydrolase
MIFTEELMNPIFDILENCRGVEQMDEHHPEGDVFTHSLQCYWWACRESKDTDLILAALLHDVGKAVISKGHEKEGLGLLDDLVSAKTLWLIQHHMRFWTYIKGEMRKLGKCLEIANHPWLPELVQLARWDKLARNPKKKVKYDREEIMERLNKIGMSRFERKEK